MVPVSVYDADARHVGSRLTACFVDLPVGEPGASMRLPVGRITKPFTFGIFADA